MGKRYRRAKRAMRPDRVILRCLTGGKHNSLKGLAKAIAGLARPRPVSRMTRENHVRLAAGKKPRTGKQKRSW